MRERDADDLRWYYRECESDMGVRSHWTAMANPAVLGCITMGSSATLDGEPPWRELDDGTITRARAVRRRLVALSQLHRDVLWVLYGCEQKEPMAALALLTEAGQAILADAELYEVTRVKRLPPRDIRSEIAETAHRLEKAQKRRDRLADVVYCSTGDVELARLALDDAEHELREARSMLDLLRGMRDAPRERKLPGVGVGKNAGLKTQRVPRPLLVALGEAVAAAPDGDLIQRRIQAQARTLAEEATAAFRATGER
jgi:hypothetical protein